MRLGGGAAALAWALAAATAAVPPPATSEHRIHFTDVTARAGLAFVHRSGASPDKVLVETFGSGVAWIDYDRDGDPDLYFVNGAPGAASVLYRNEGDGTFTDVTARAGVAAAGPAAVYKTGVAVGDFDGDGHPDLYVAAFGPNLLFRNNGDGTFADVTARAGVAGLPDEWSTSSGFLDYDRDGDLDLYVVNYLDYQLDDNPYCGFRREGYRMYCHPTMFDGKADRLFRNEGDGTFTDVSERAGIANPTGKGLGVTFCDIDRDRDTDIYVANDTVRNFLFRNNGDGTFTDIAYGAGVGFDRNGKPQAGMGVDCADLDADGLPDLFVTNFADELNALYRNLGDGIFEEVAEAAGLGSGYQPLGFGTKLFDADNDGDLDIYVANGHVIDNVALYQPASAYAQRDLVYANEAGRFTDVTSGSGPGLDAIHVGRGLAVADFDNDGRLDIAISNLGQAPQLLRNEGGGGGHWIAIRAEGRGRNTAGLGARVEVVTDAGTQVREVNNVASYQSSNDVRLHIGLGSARTVRRLTVSWPGGATQVLEDVRADQVLVVKEPEAGAASTPKGQLPISKDQLPIPGGQAPVSR